MTVISRTERVSAAFVTLADTLVADYDIVDLLHTLVERCVDLLDAAAAGLLLADPTGQLQVMASTSEESQLVEVFQVQAGAGPCVESYTTGVAVSIDDIAGTGDRWPEFRDIALSQGFRSVHAIPMRVHGKMIGALNLLRNEVGVLNPEDAALGQALADVATISILHERTLRESTVVNEQLQRALNSRILIEQAKGVIAHTSTVSMDEAFQLLRAYARAHSQNLHITAEDIVRGSLVL